MPSRPQTRSRRKAPDERRAEIVETAARLAVTDGLERVTARRVAEDLGVFPGLINHYFPSVDDLVAAAFAHAASAERDEVLGDASASESPLARVRHCLTEWLDPARDPVSLLWLDAWQASRRRPALLVVVGEQMNIDADRLTALIDDGARSGEFHLDRPREAALQILSLVDGLSVQAAIRDTLDYSSIRTFVITTSERLLGLPPGALAP